jgi:hypothetical protein
MRAHHAGNGIAIAQPNAIEPNLDGLQHELLGMRGAAQKREIRRNGEFKILSGTVAFHEHINHHSDTSAEGSADRAGAPHLQTGWLAALREFQNNVDALCSGCGKRD